jgi:hypothetical protein
LLKFISIICLLLVSAQATHANTSSANATITSQTPAIKLTPYTANYEATWKAGWFPITIDATRTLEKVNNHWKVSFEAYSSVADLSEISEFNLTDQQITPINYRYKTSGFLSKKLRTLEFNHEKGKAWLPYKKKWGNYELTREVQDNLSYQEQIRLDLMAGKTEFNYSVAYKNRLKKYQFVIAGESTMNTSSGPISVIEVRQIGLDKKESNQIWLAKDHEFLIVKLKVTKSNGTSNTIKLKQAKIGQDTIHGL